MKPNIYRAHTLNLLHPPGLLKPEARAVSDSISLFPMTSMNTVSCVFSCWPSPHSRSEPSPVHTLDVHAVSYLYFRRHISLAPFRPQQMRVPRSPPDNTLLLREGCSPPMMPSLPAVVPPTYHAMSYLLKVSPGPRRMAGM